MQTKTKTKKITSKRAPAKNLPIRRIVPNKDLPILPVVVSMGCAAGVGPEIVLGASRLRGMPPLVIVGDWGALTAGAHSLGWPATRLSAVLPYDPLETLTRGLRFQASGGELNKKDRKWGKPTHHTGLAQLQYIEDAYCLAKERGWPLVTGPVSKEAIANCGARRAKKFRGHTEWLEELDSAPHSVMCFSSKRLTTSLVTTHIPIRQVAKVLTAKLVTKAILELVDLLLRQGVPRPNVSVCSLNPHGGEGELLGDEERKVIIPGIFQAQKTVKRRASISGPLGAETAYRKGAAGVFDGVVGIYHDQATIPMKLLDFGGAVNITQGLSLVRTSVDHGTAYDIAGNGLADPRGMREAIVMAGRLGHSSRKIEHGKW